MPLYSAKVFKARVTKYNCARAIVSSVCYTRMAGAKISAVSFLVLRRAAPDAPIEAGSKIL
jgi:hypothetical protein